MIQRIVRKALWGLFFFAFFEKFFVPILTSGGYVGLSIASLRIDCRSNLYTGLLLCNEEIEVGIKT